ncbi:MAG: polysaccharide deacetylase family protein [Alkalinema sp. RU_4_3]|nr:polysaccharide deacetylase family protein [Alkalinema sp. RU_4_3]
MPRPKQIFLSFDIEEFDVPLEYGHPIDMDEQFRVSKIGLDAILDLLDRLGIRATFFITAHFAQHHPASIARITQTHEVASHGFYHSQFDVADLGKSRQVLQQLSGQTVLGFRMARLQPVSEEAIAQAGYRYNSSLNPTWLPGRYNHLTKPRKPTWSGTVLTIPVSVTPLIRFPLFWLSFKNLPLGLYKLLSAWTLGCDRALNLYFHPWEFAPIQHYGLPGYLSRHGGAEMVERLEDYLIWLNKKAVFATFNTMIDV